MLDADIREYLDDKFQIVNEIKKTVDNLAEKIPPISERVSGCEKDIKYIHNDLCLHIQKTEKEFDKVWNKNRDQDKAVNFFAMENQKSFDVISKKIYFYAGGIAGVVFIITIIAQKVF